MLIAADTTSWYIGLGLGAVVVVVAVIIVVTILVLANRIAGQAETAVGAVDAIKAQTDELSRRRQDQRLGGADPARGPGPAEDGCGALMTVVLALADSERTLWYVTLAVGLVVALVVAGMLLLLLHLLRRIQNAVGGLLDSAGKVAENTANIPQLEATAPVLSQIASEGVVQDGYMNALSQGYNEEAAMSTTTCYILSVAEAVVLVVVLALALIEIRRRLLDIAKGLGTLGDALTTVEEEHLRPLRPAVEAINAQFDGIIALMPGVAKKAAIVARALGERQVTLVWIGDIVLIAVLVPVVVYLLRGVLGAAKAVTPTVDALVPVAEAASKDLDAVELLDTTRSRSPRSASSRTTAAPSTRSSRTPEWSPRSPSCSSASSW